MPAHNSRISRLEACNSFGNHLSNMTPEERDARFEELIRKGYPRNGEKILKLMREDQEAQRAPHNRKVSG